MNDDLGVRTAPSFGADGGRAWAPFVRLIALLAFLAPLVSCSLYRNDRCYVDDVHYEVAYNLFLESGSLDLVERQLVEYQWKRCLINESVYRLKKEFEIAAE